MSRKKRQANGFWEIEKNPLSRVGVFPYLGAHLPQAPDPTRFYQVYRPAEELGRPETVESFKLQPWTIDHAMLGDEEKGLCPAEKKGIHGVIGEQVFFDEAEGVLYGNIKCLSQSLDEAISEGTEELSLGYFYSLEWTGGEYRGQPYDAIQRHINGNHLALVDEGRMGPGIAVQDSDSKRGYALESITLKTEEQGMNPEELAKRVEIVETALKAIADRLDRMAGAGTDNEDPASPAARDGEDPEKPAGQDDNEPEKPAGTDNGDPAAPAAPAAKDNEDPAKATGQGNNEPEKPAGTDNDDPAAPATPAAKDKQDPARPAGQDNGPSTARGMDSMPQILAHISRRDGLGKALLPLVGTFDYSAMTEAQVAAYGCRKLGLKVPAGGESAALKGYLAAVAARPLAPAFGMDAAPKAAPSGKSPALNNYLEGK